MFNYAILVVFTALMIWGTLSLPERGDPDAPAHRKVNVVGDPVAGAYFIDNAMADAATPNIVTVVLADYRSIDTLGEVIVVFTAGMACYLILRRREDD
ncbi:MAG: hydrogen gas-evolving membrane-bound hydrogenase subunit E [Opitutales bacterium]